MRPPLLFQLSLHSFIYPKLTYVFLFEPRDWRHLRWKHGVLPIFPYMLIQSAKLADKVRPTWQCMFSVGG